MKTRPARTRRAVRVTSTIAIALLIVVAVAITASVRLVVFPDRDPVAQSDAIVILGPVDDRRLAVADSLLDQHLSSTLALASFSSDEPFCHNGRPNVEVICFRPDPATTRGEATWVRDEARARGWRAVTVITVGSHIERARFVFRNCLGSDVDVSVIGEARFGDDLRYVVHDVLYQSAAFFKAALVTPGCAA